VNLRLLLTFGLLLGGCTVEKTTNIGNAEADDTDDGTSSDDGSGTDDGSGDDGSGDDGSGNDGSGTDDEDNDGDGYSEADGDCDDSASWRYPGATELCNGLDDNCDDDDDDQGIATWFDGDGAATDMTTSMTGADGAPSAVSLSSAGTLALCPGTWYANLEVTDDVSILGVGDGVTLSGGGTGTVITVPDSVTISLDIEGITITGGMSESDAGGLNCLSDSEVTITDTTFTENTGRSGSAIFGHCELTISGSTFNYNTALYAGTINTDGLFVIKDSFIEFNNASGSGGGISTSTYYGEISNTEIRYNSSTGSGGGVYVLQGNVDFEGVLFEHNSTAGSEPGGGVSLAQGSSGTFENCTFKNNEGAGGGGLYAYGLGSDATGFEISNSTFESNTATQGGAINMRGADGAILDTLTFKGNTADGVGGAIYFHADSGEAQLTDVSFEDNTGAGSDDSLYHTGAARSYDWEDESISTTCDASGC
jgi:predicted outer membrane repeat protein